MTLTISFLNNATGKAAVYLDRTDLNAFTLKVATDAAAATAVASLRIRFPVSIFDIATVRTMGVATAGWTAVAAGPFLTLTAPAGTTLSSAAPLTLALTGVSSTKTAATNDDLQVFVGSDAPTAKVFLMRYPAEAGDLTAVLAAAFLPATVYRTPSTFDKVQNVLTLRLSNLNPSGPLVTAAWVRRPTIRLSFVYGNDIGSLTPDDPPNEDLNSAFNIHVDPVATYKDGTHTYEWTTTPPDSGASDTAPVWTLQPVPENTAVLGAGSGATAEFRLSGLSTSAPAGATLAYLQFSDFPGYSDGYITLPLAKVEPEPAIIYFDGVPNCVAALGDSVTLEWQTFAMARVDLLVGDTPVAGLLDPRHGSHTVAIDRNTDVALLAYTKASDTTPAHTAQWTAHVPDARIKTFTADHPTVAAGSPVVLSWTTAFALSGAIKGDTAFTIPAAALASGSKTYYPHRPTSYTLHLTGEGNPPDQTVNVFVLQPGWSQRPMGFSPNTIHAPVLYGTDTGLTLVSGQSDNPIFQSADGTQWDQTGVAQFPSRGEAAGCVFNGNLWIMGGQGRSHGLNDVWSSPDGLTWTQVTAAAGWSARQTFACAAFNNRLWVLGGRGMTGSPMNDVWSSADGVTWTAVATGNSIWSPRAGAAVAVAAGKLWLFGGRLDDGTVSDELWSSPDGATWTKVQTSEGWGGSGPAGRWRATLASLDGKTLCLFGGIDRSGAPLGDLNLFDGGGWDLGTGVTDWSILCPASTAWRGALWFAGGMYTNDAANDAVWSWFPADGDS